MSKYTPKHSEPEQPKSNSVEVNTSTETTSNGKRIGFFADILKDKKKLAYSIASVVAIIALIVSGIFVYNDYWGAEVDETLNDYKVNVTDTPVEEGELPTNAINFTELQKDFPDAVAWITIPGAEDECDAYPWLKNLPIDYPIMQSDISADDNFYLDHDRFGNEDKAGSIYIQKLNHDDFSDQNTLIYGHNMKNGTMFAQLKKFRDKDFFDKHRTMYIYIPGRILEYEIISAFVYDDRHILNSFNFAVEEECQEFFDACTNPKSFTKQVVEGASLTQYDKIITLSTCTSNEKERYLVVGKLVKDTETKN